MLEQEGHSHFCREVAAFLSQHFQNSYIWRQFPVACLSKSPHLTALDCYFWKCMNAVMCAVKASTRTELLSQVTDVQAHKRN
jgi:hypothetical protein